MDKIITAFALLAVLLAFASATYGYRRYGRSMPPPHRWFGRPGPITPDMLDGSFWMGGKGMTLIVKHGASKPRPVFPRGELVFTTDDKMFHVGDGETPGGVLHWKLVR